MIEGWSDEYCGQFGERISPVTRENPTDCPKKPYCTWKKFSVAETLEDLSEHSKKGKCIGIPPYDNDPPHNDWRKYLLEKEREEESAKDKELIRLELRKRKAREREREELERLEANMNTPPESPRLDELRGILRKPEMEQRQSERLHSSLSSAEARQTMEVAEAVAAAAAEQRNIRPTVPTRRRGPQRSVPEAGVVDPRDYQIAQPVPEAEVVPPYQRDSRQQNIFLKNKYYFITPDQYDFDPNSNVPRGSGMVRSVGRNRPFRDTPKKKSGVSGRIQKKPTSKPLDKPARPEKKIVKEKIKSPPLDFNKTLNQLLPIILIFAIAIYLFFNLKKWNRTKL